MQAGDSIPGGAIDGIELSCNQDFAVRLKGYAVDFGAKNALGPGAGVKTCVETSVRIKARDIIARRSIKSGEVAPNQNFAIGLNDDGINVTQSEQISELIDSGARVEGGVHSAVGVEPGEAAMGSGKRSADDEFSIRLTGDGPDGEIKT